MENIVFICIDCLRNDFIEKDYANTPFLDSFVKDSLYFSNLYSTTTTTTPSVVSFMTGLYSENNGVKSLKKAEISEDVTTLAEKIKENGYKTYAEPTGPLVTKTGLDRGFNHYNNRSIDKGLFNDWKNNLEQEIQEYSEPFFLYLHLWELHRPIEVPEKFQDSKYGETDYGKALSALDRKLKDLIQSLPEDTTIIIHGDHGESLQWRDNIVQRNIKKGRTLLRYILGINTRPIERFMNQITDKDDFKDHFIEDGHGENIFDFATNVPFIINSDSIENQKVEKQVRQIDIYPTVLNLIGQEPDSVDGKTLLPPEKVEDRAAYIRACGSSLKKEKNWIRGIKDGKWKFFEYYNRDWSDELYNLEKDPKELKNINDAEKKQEMKSKIPEFDEKKSKELEIKEKLKKLGYE